MVRCLIIKAAIGTIIYKSLCICIKIWAAYICIGAGSRSFENTTLFFQTSWNQTSSNPYCSNPSLISMLQINLHRSIFPQPTIHRWFLNEPRCTNRYIAPPPQPPLHSRIFYQNSLLPSLCKAALWNLPWLRFSICFASFLSIFITWNHFRQICVFFISFSLIPSMCPSRLFLQWKYKASILIHQLNVVCMRIPITRYLQVQSSGPE